MNNPLIRDKQFGAFFWTQFFGAFNEYLLKLSVTLAVSHHEALQANGSTGLLLNAIAGAFVLPMLLFSSSSGQLADKFDKTTLMRWVKYSEPFIVLVLTVGFALDRLEILLFAVLLMGTHTALFGPCKYAYLPEHVKSSALVSANAWVEGSFFVAIVLATVMAGSLISSKISHAYVYVLCGVSLVCALLGVYAATRLPATPPRQAKWTLNWNVPQAIWHSLEFASQHRRVWPAMLGIAWLWFVGTIYLTQLPVLATAGLHASAGVATCLLLAFTVGFAGGAGCSVRWSGQRTELGLVPVGLMFMILGGLGLLWVLGQDSSASSEQTVFLFVEKSLNWVLLLCMSTMGFGAGVYGVPLHACVQSLAPRTHRARVVAANLFINAVFMGLSVGFAVVVFALSRGRVSWVFGALTGLNVLVLLLWVFRQPHVLLRFLLLFSIQQRRHLPVLDDAAPLGFSGGGLIVVPTLLHENYMRRFACLPLECTVVLSGRLPTTRMVEWLRQNHFVQEYTQLEEAPAQGELIRQIAAHIQQNRIIAIDKPMYEVLRKRYRLDDMPLVLFKKGFRMHVFECRTDTLDKEDNSHLVWHLIEKEIAPA